VYKFYTRENVVGIMVSYSNIGQGTRSTLKFILILYEPIVGAILDSISNIFLPDMFSDYIFCSCSWCMKIDMNTDTGAEIDTDTEMDIGTDMDMDTVMERTGTGTGTGTQTCKQRWISGTDMDTE
jgi:hypothetical protein